jgi:D-alanyl-D-alanine carboxypeptidase
VARARAPLRLTARSARGLRPPNDTSPPSCQTSSGPRIRNTIRCVPAPDANRLSRLSETRACPVEPVVDAGSPTPDSRRVSWVPGRRSIAAAAAALVAAVAATLFLVVRDHEPSAARPGTVVPDDPLAALSAYADELAGDDEFAGAVLVARHGKVLLEQAWGLADRDAGTPNTPDTKFRLGSMNKLFTAVATLQLVESGMLALDDTIGEHLPDYPNKEVAAKVTVRHLLTHTGGTGDIFGPEFERHRLKLREHDDYVRLYGLRGLLHEPGERFEYSNYGFILLGALIEAVSGESYYDYVHEHVFRPAGMTATGSLPESHEVPKRAVGYMKPFGADTWRPNTGWLPWRGMAAGGGYSTVGDLLRFAEALRSGKLISKESLEAATRPYKQQYGYGFGVQGEGRFRSYGHGGGAPGPRAVARLKRA